MSVNLESIADVLNVISNDLASLRQDQVELRADIATLRSDTAQEVNSVVSDGQNPDAPQAQSQTRGRDSDRHSQPHQPQAAADSTAQSTGLDGLQHQSEGASADFQSASSRSIHRRGDAPSPIQDIVVNAAEVQRDFEVIKNSLQRVRLPNNVRVFDSKSGIKKDCQPTLSVVSKCARYSETAIKQLLVLIGDCEAGRVVNSDQLQTLFTILQAEVCYLQGECSALIVRSSFDTDTAAIFKWFEGNHGALNERSMTNLQRAAEITAAAGRGLAQSSSYTRGRGRGGRGRFNRDYHQFNRDVYQNVASRSNIPPRRPGGFPNPQNDFTDER